MRSRFRFRRSTRAALGIVVGAFAVMALGPATASASHIDPSSTKTCGTSGPGVSCTLTIQLGNNLPIDPADVITADLVTGPNPPATGVTYKSATATGGTCAGGATVTVTPTQLQIDPLNAGSIMNCSIIVDEVLRITGAGEVCQQITSPGNSPAIDACAPIALCAGVTHLGTAGPDNIPGTAGRDVIDAGAGDDTVQAGGGDDVVCGRDGNDTLRGGAGDDDLFGELGNDALFGDAGDDFLDGGAGRDTGNGGPGGGTDSATGVEKPTNIP